MNSEFNIDNKKVNVRQVIFTWSNFISFSRILISGPIIYLYELNGQRPNMWVVLLILYMVISDYLDGFIARVTDRISEFGKLLDPVADKVAALILFLYMYYLDRIPTEFLIFNITRDSLILLGSAYIRRKRGKVPMSVWSGKLAVNILSAYWLCIFFEPDWTGLSNALMWATVGIMVYSFFHYFYRFYQILKGAEFN